MEKPKCVNIVWYGELGYPINIEKLSPNISSEQGCNSAKIRLEKATITLHHTGSYIIYTTRRPAEIMEIVAELERAIKERNG